MRALIRGTEICLENSWTKWQRMNLLFLTGKEKDPDGNPVPGDGWTLVEDYVPPEDTGTQPPSAQNAPVEEYVRPVIPDSETEVEFAIQERGVGVEHANTPAPETVTIDGKTYTKDELLALLNQTS